MLQASDSCSESESKTRVHHKQYSSIVSSEESGLIWNGHITIASSLVHAQFRGVRSRLNSEAKELSRIICSRCRQKAYEECRKCKIYLLINRIASE
jgi:hypothetical protein